MVDDLEHDWIEVDCWGSQCRLAFILNGVRFDHTCAGRDGATDTDSMIKVVITGLQGLARVSRMGFKDFQNIPAHLRIVGIFNMTKGEYFLKGIPLKNAELLNCVGGAKPWSAFVNDDFDTFSRDPHKIVIFASSASAAEFAELAPRTIAAIHKDDPLVIKLMQRGARYIGEALTAACRKSGELVYLLGGLGPHNRNVFDEQIMAAWRLRLEEVV